MVKNKPILHNWIVMGSRIWGETYNDDRMPNGTILITSEVVNLDRENGILETKNTTYDLGKEL